MADRPNVLLVCTDHWPGYLLGINGHPCIQTPTLDQLCRNGVRYTRAYSETPVCVPARRTLMTGTPPRIHGDRTFQGELPMPKLPTLAQTFRDAGYQAYAVGKLHVYPQRDRIGFDDVILGEEGRAQFGVVDDYELFLGDRGCAGQQFNHGMGNNEYVNRPWHLAEELHVTNWATQQMVRTIQRRDPTRPALWYLSYSHPHPPLAPLQIYLDMYREMHIDLPGMGEWAEALDLLPSLLRERRALGENFTDYQVRAARRAFYALCSHIDHQLRVVIGTLREQGVLNNTVIMFTSDHGDMLGQHGLWAKSLYYEESAQVPMILSGAVGDERVGCGQVDDRLVGWQDVMPTLLQLAGIETPDTVVGHSMVGDERREYLYGEMGAERRATRMLHDGRYKLIYYAAGNCLQLFDLENDPQESNDLAAVEEYESICRRLEERLIGELYGGDVEWVRDGELVGLPDGGVKSGPNRQLSGQRGGHWPPPPIG
jgi:arylsulfatase